MPRTFFDFDSKLRALKTANGKPHNFKRFPSLSSLAFDFTQCDPGNVTNEQIAHFEQMIRRQLVAKFAIPTLTRSDFGQLVNVDEALEGIPECYRHTRPVKSVLKIGLNVSGDYYATSDVFALRCAAVLAIVNLAKSRGQKVQFDVCYGYCGSFSTRLPEGHSRITVSTLTTKLLKHIMGSVEFRNQMINHYANQELAGGYQLHWIASHYGLKNEFDFVLDRLETPTFTAEYARILSQIEHLR